MYRIFTLFLILMHLNTILSASALKSTTQPRYYVQLGAYKNPDYAKKVVLSTEFPVQIVHEEPFYNVLAGPYDDLTQAKNALAQLRQKYREAYLVKRQTKPYPLKQQKVTTQAPSLWQQALYFYRHGSYEEALALFDRILIENPDLQKAKLYYAKTLFKLKLYREAKNEFLALKQHSLTSDEQKEISRYLNAIDKQNRQKLFQTTLTLGVGFDDNINLTTDRAYTQYGPYLLKNDTNKTESSYAIAALLLSHTYKTPEYTLNTNLYSYNELLHSAEGNDLNFVDLSSGLYKQIAAFNLGIRAGANSIYLDGKHISYDLYTVPSVTYALSKQLQIKLSAGYTNNHTEFADDRDYRRYDTGAQIVYTKEQLTFLSSYQLMRYKAKEEKRYDISKDLSIYTLYMKYRLFKMTDIACKISYEAHRFSTIDPLLGYAREDDKKRLKLTAGRSLSKKATLFINYEHTDSDSNINVYTYTKNLYTVLFQYRF